jgi:hypothetical protein
MNAKIIEFAPRAPAKAISPREIPDESISKNTEVKQLDRLFELWRIQLLRDDDDLDKPPARTPHR